MNFTEVTIEKYGFPGRFLTGHLFRFKCCLPYVMMIVGSHKAGPLRLGIEIKLIRSKAFNLLLLLKV